MSVTVPMPSQRGHMPPVMEKLRFTVLLADAALDGDRPGAVDRGDVEGERLGRADVRLAEPAEEDAQHRVGVGGGADRGAGVGAHPLLVDDDRRRQPVEHVDVRPRQRRHEALHEGAVGLVDHPLRLGGDRAEHQRALARAGDAGEHRQPALRDLDADVLEVVHARALHADQIVAVGLRLALLIVR